MHRRVYQNFEFQLLCFTASLAILKWWMMASLRPVAVAISSLLVWGLMGLMIQTTLSKASGRGLRGKPRARIVFFVNMVGLGIALLPFGFFGLSSYIKTAIPLTGNQFTWLTINRFWLIGWGGLVFLIYVVGALIFRRVNGHLFALTTDHPLTAFKAALHEFTIRDLGFSIVQVVLAAGCVIGIVAIGALISYVWPSQLMLAIVAGVINALVPLLEILVVIRLFGDFPNGLRITKAQFGPLLGLLVLVMAVGALTPQYRPASRPQIIIVHRGVINGDDQPNTIAALKKNANRHFAYVEMDIQETADHQFICAHDDTVSIPGRGRVEIDRLSLKTIRRYHHVELFKEYLYIANRIKQPIIVELKITNHSDPLMGSRFASQFGRDMVKQPNMVHSVGYKELRQIKDRVPAIKVGLVTMLNFADIARYKVDFYTLQHITLTPFLLRSIPQSRPVYAWTDNRVVTMKRLQLMGIDGQVTDQATKLHLLRRAGPHDYFLLVFNFLITYL